jgi:hypothetical protein
MQQMTTRQVAACSKLANDNGRRQLFLFSNCPLKLVCQKKRERRVFFLLKPGESENPRERKTERETASAALVLFCFSFSLSNQIG